MNQQEKLDRSGAQVPADATRWEQYFRENGCSAGYCYISGSKNLGTNSICSCCRRPNLSKQITIERRIKYLDDKLKCLGNLSKEFIEISVKHNQSPFDMIIEKKYNECKERLRTELEA